MHTNWLLTCWEVVVEKYYKAPFPIVKSSCLIRTEGFLYGKNTAVLHYVAFTGSDVLFLSLLPSLPRFLAPSLAPSCPSLPSSSTLLTQQSGTRVQTSCDPWFQKLCAKWHGMPLARSNINYARDFCFIYLQHFLFSLLELLGLPARGTPLTARGR